MADPPGSKERFPVEVLSMILGYADRTAILICLRVSKHHHALAIRHIDVVYNHEFIDRDTIESVFDGIAWELVEEGWTGIDDSSMSQSADEEVWDAEEEAGGEPQYLASTLFDPLTRPEQLPSPIASDPEKPSAPSPPVTSTTRLVGLPYDSSRLGQHLRKRYCLSLCRTLTLGDSWHLDLERDARFHTHGVLDNGRAHHLFQEVDTLRTINPSITGSNPCGSHQCKIGALCPFMQELRPKKIVHRNFGTDARYEIAENASETKVVVFLPCHVWPAGPRGSAFPLEFVTTDMTLVFGPWARKTSHTAFWAAMEPWSTSTTCYRYRRLRLVVMEAISSAAARRGGSLRVVGLERTQVLHDPENRRVRVSGHANNREARMYDPVTPRSLVEARLDKARTDPRHPVLANVTYQTIEEYVASNPIDELFEHELHPPKNPSEWWISQYWTPDANWAKYPPVPKLGERSIGLGSNRVDSDEVDSDEVDSDEHEAI